MCRAVLAVALFLSLQLQRGDGFGVDLGGTSAKRKPQGNHIEVFVKKLTDKPDTSVVVPKRASRRLAGRYREVNLGM